ncbi:MAG: MarR family winged helix-turn-helix transcriptional regulator [Solidesulfovibrio sp.]|uniref:MarR family winged helix-turn-helix transcriptional regulator n=1 Tax=Solidesulfovibrio sp. TaxID=2910990 RepID=UPI0031595C11
MHEHVPPKPAPGPCHCANLRRAARALSRRYDEALAPSGLGVSQYSLLRALSRHEPATAAGLGAVMGLDRTTLVRNVALLSKQGLVVSAVDASDKRSRKLRLTPAGSAALQAATPLWEAAQRALEADLGADGRQALDAALAALAGLGE